jgi:flagellar biosynthesis protein FlhF
MVMRIKRYDAEERDLPRIIRQIRRDLGENAVMKTRRYKKGGILGFGGKAMVEVYAGVDRNLPWDTGDGTKPSIAGSVLLDQLLQSTTNGGNQNGQTNALRKSNNNPPVTIYQPPGSSPAISPSTQTAVAAPASTRLETEIQRLAKEIADIRRTLEDSVGEKKEKGVEEEGRRLPRWLGHVREKLLANEVSPKIAEAMLDETLQAAETDALADFEETLAAFQRTVTTSVEARGSLVGTQTPRVLALAGPTGVGKTTTLAKLAATANLLDKQRVGLISADTYRIAAIDQLKTFAGILDIPVKVVFSPAELREALRDFAGMDRIFIDTAGRSPNNDERIEELRQLIEAHEDVACHLVISATTRPKDMLLICERFRPAKFTRFVFTKIDETDTLGPLLSLMYTEGLPPSYLTNGQSVPDDIILGEESDLLSLVIRRSLI